MAPVVATPHGGDRSKVETFHHADAGETRDKIGAFAGVSGRKVEKIAPPKCAWQTRSIAGRRKVAWLRATVP